ncbi:hypothetical protein JVT61DRAFT_443 [Boletus reticuloceps]|uniref:Uncharacterized protein n=1 Tax=Boletus reticuloceps TaxID=495285 RepID=A0A8I2YYJ1_9AGAM|nr:hypothetical protein JVT61DRAFT_443 [Boletus reticuloceps]
MVKGASIDNASYGVYSYSTTLMLSNLLLAQRRSMRRPSIALVHLYRCLNVGLCRCVDMRGADGDRKCCFKPTQTSNLNVMWPRDVIRPISLCGICRQVIREFCHVDMPVLLVPGDYPRSGDSTEDVNGGGVIEETVGTLLPRSLGPTELENVRLDGFVRGLEE